MKVYIGPYKNWFGPYQLAELLCFWAKKEKDKFGFEETPEWVHNFGTWLSEDKNGNDSWLTKICQWIDSKRKRKIKIKIDRWDTWSMDHTLALIALPMLKQLQKEKHGSFIVDDEDVPYDLRTESQASYSSLQVGLFPETEKTVDHALDEMMHRRCDWVMHEMIWAFEQLIDDDNDAQFHSGISDYKSVPCEWDEDGKAKMYRMEQGPNHTAVFDSEGFDKHHERINNGLRLFGKYYRGLWD